MRAKACDARFYVFTPLASYGLTLIGFVPLKNLFTQWSLTQIDFDARTINEHFHEQVLCTLRLQRSGMLTITPGFDAGDSNSGCQEPAFTAQFTTSKGSVYEYSLERLHIPKQKMGSRLGEIMTANRQQDQLSIQKKQRRLRLLRTTLQHRLTGEEYHEQYRTLVEIVSAQCSNVTAPFSCFGGPPMFSVEYDIQLPDHMKKQAMLSPLQGSSPFTSSSNYYGDPIIWTMDETTTQKCIFVSILAILVRRL